jgi:hypothetical protein
MTITLLVKQISVEEHPLPHRRVKAVHGETGQMLWQHSREQTIEHIRNRAFRYYFLREGRAVRIVLDRLADGEAFLKAETDAEKPEALLQLPLFQPETLQPPPAHE